MRKFVLFDFDGVIADSIRLGFEVAQAVHPHFTMEKWLPMFEGNIYANYDHSECTDACLPSQEDYFSLYSPRIGEIQSFDGIPEVVRSLSTRCDLAVVSSSISTDILACLKRFGIADCFLDVLGKDVHMSKVQKIETVLTRYGARADDCVFVTDTLGDIREAGEHGIGAIACSWGFHGRETLAKGEPFRIVDAPKDLPNAVQDYFANATVPLS